MQISLFLIMISFKKQLCLLTAVLTLSVSFGQSGDHVAGELLIQLKPGSDLNGLTQKIEADLHQKVRSLVCISDVMQIYQLQFENEHVNLEAALKELLIYPEITLAQKNHAVYERETIPSDTLFDNQWHHKNTGQTGGIVDADIDSPEAWDITSGGLTTHGDTIVVCIIEGNGVDINHADLKDNIWKNYAEIPDDGLDNDNNGYVDDFNGWHVINLDDVIGAGSHGTRVAGMIGATGNNVTGVSGVNWEVKMMIVQGQQASNEATVIAAYTYPLKMRKRYNETLGQEGAFVVATNSSWGIDNASATNSPLWCAMYDSLGYYGILNIAATTNNNSNVDLVGDMPTTCTSQFLVGVTMTNSQDLRASSGYGTTHVDLGAPGQSVQTTTPGGYTTTSGTSFASPCVAGCVALAYSAPCAEFINLVKFNPAAAALDMRQYLLESVDQNAGLMTEVASGGRANVKNYIDSLLAACDPGACISPYNLATTGITDSVVQISWQGFSSDYIVYLTPSGGATTAIPVNGANTLNVDSLTPCTYYTLHLQANCGTDSSNLSFPLTFRTDGCCENPLLSLNTSTENSLTLEWDAVLYATSYDLRYKKVSDATWIEYTNVTAPYAISGLTACTAYEFQIHTQCADSTHGYGNTQLFTTLGCGACTEKTYCSVSGANYTTEWIQSIAINGFSNTTGSNSGWLQSNQIITALTPGASYPITFTPGYSGFAFTEGFSVWIDFDQDGNWTPAENLITNLTTNASVSGMLTIPAGAPIGVTRMRIGMSATSAPEICPIASFYGEYEDYCVYIGPQAGLDEQKTDISIYPNPASDCLYLQNVNPWQLVRILDYSGKIVKETRIDGQGKLTIQDLSNGVYFLQVQSETGSSVIRFIKSE